jgi:hypothetical protein
VSYGRGVRTLLVLMLAIGCKGSERKAVPPRVSTLPPLAAAPTATIDPPNTPAEFPKEPPAIVLWQGGGEPPRTILSIRVWPDGTVRFPCNRRGMLPRERVTAMVDTFDRAGWLPPAGTPLAAPSNTDTACITTSVQLERDGRTVRRNSSCGMPSDAVDDALGFIQAVVGPDPCRP